MIRKVLLVSILILLSAPYSGCAVKENVLIRELSYDGHMSISVNFDRKIIEEDGEYYVVTTLGGKEIEKRFGVKTISNKKEIANVQESRAEHITKHVEILDPVLELPEDNEIPRWTYEVYGNPAMITPVYVKADPINVVFELSSSFLAWQLERGGWEKTSSINLFSANVNYVPYNGRMMPQSKNYTLSAGPGKRYHLRTWRCGSVIVGQAHMDIGLPHKACMYENAEIKVVYEFILHKTRRNSIWLDNICRDHKGYKNNGWASYITSYKYTN